MCSSPDTRAVATGNSEVAQLYREVILSHAAKPVGHGAEIAATHRASRNNPLCGDEIEILLQIEGDSVQAAAFTGDACAICLASASLLCSHLPGRTAGSVQVALDGFGAALADAVNDSCPDYLVPLLGVRNYPARLDCATLPWEAALAALAPGT